jgi:hypothetical protein
MVKPTKINLVINLLILGMLIYLAVQVHDLKNPPKYQPAMGMVQQDEFETAIRNFLINKLQEAE